MAMAGTLRIVKVFLGSPGDLDPEREAAKEEIDNFNRLWSEDFGYHVQLVRWEDTGSQTQIGADCSAPIGAFEVKLVRAAR